jgi:hypothetical protein
VLADDPDDLPTAALVLLVAPAVVLSDDSDLVDNRFAGQAWWTHAAGDVFIVAEADCQVVGLFGGVSLTTMAVGYGAVGDGAHRSPRNPGDRDGRRRRRHPRRLLPARPPLPHRLLSHQAQGACSVASMTWQEVTESQHAAAAPHGRRPTVIDSGIRPPVPSVRLMARTH